PPGEGMGHMRLTGKADGIGYFGDTDRIMHQHLASTAYALLQNVLVWRLPERKLERMSKMTSADVSDRTGHVLHGNFPEAVFADIVERAAHAARIEPIADRSQCASICT